MDRSDDIDMTGMAWRVVKEAYLNMEKLSKVLGLNNKWKYNQAYVSNKEPYKYTVFECEWTRVWKSCPV